MDTVIRDARVLVIAKAYPNPSRSHGEVVCTAGLLNGEQWVRIYPVSYRFLKDNRKYPKYGWITLDLERRVGKDFRPESYHPMKGDQEDIKVSGLISTKGSGWNERRRYLLQHVHTSMDELISEAKGSAHTSLGIVKPSKILDVIAEEVDREWDKAAIERAKNYDLFDNGDGSHPKKLVRKVPYKFSYVFQTEDGKDRTIMIEDWEIGMLYWNCLDHDHKDERIAVDHVKEKLWHFASDADLHLVMGTTLEHHAQNAPNPFVIISLFYPPLNPQPELL